MEHGCTSTPSRDTGQYNCIAQLVTWPLRPPSMHILELSSVMYTSACPHRALALLESSFVLLTDAPDGRGLQFRSLESV